MLVKMISLKKTAGTGGAANGETSGGVGPDVGYGRKR